MTRAGRRMAPLLIACAILALGPAHAPAQELHSATIRAAEDQAGFLVTIRARAPGASWEIPGAECAVLRLAVDGRYDQHVFLTGGGEERDYGCMVGPLAAGEHRLGLAWDRTWTPALERGPEVLALEAQPLRRDSAAAEPMLRSPTLYLRQDTIGRVSDVPLLLYYEREKMAGGGTALVYTVILSNEDGGTNTERLMARWGRTTDIEWCYAFSESGARPEETLQGKDHETLPFRGVHDGRHPRLHIATWNNIFSDTIPEEATARVRLTPVAGDLRGGARETVMDRFPWTYAIMAREMQREGKIEPAADPDTVKVSDLRNYAYLEACADQRGTELHFELELRSGRRFASDHGDPKARIGRSGCFRSTVELPPGTRPQDLAALHVQCTTATPAKGQKPEPSPRASVRAIARLFFLDADFRPGPNLLDTKVGKTMRPGQSLRQPLQISR